MAITEYLGTAAGGGGGGNTTTPSLVIVNKGDAQAVQPNASTPIEFRNIVKNDGGQYSTNDYAITVAESGYYIASASVATLGGWSAGETQVVEIHVDEVLAPDGYIGRETKEVNTNGAGWLITQSCGSIPLSLTAGQKVKCKLYQDRGIALDLVTNGQGQNNGQLNYFTLLKVAELGQNGRLIVLDMEQLNNFTQYAQDGQYVWVRDEDITFQFSETYERWDQCGEGKVLAAGLGCGCLFVNQIQVG